MYIVNKPEINSLLYERFDAITMLKAYEKMREHDPKSFSKPEELNKSKDHAVEQVKTCDNELQKLVPGYDREKQKEFDKRGWWAGRNLSAMASELGESVSRHYEFRYWMFSIFSHPNPFGQTDYAKITETKVTLDDAPAYTYTSDLLQSLSSLLLTIISVSDDFFNLDRRERILKFKESYQKLIDEKG